VIGSYCFLSKKGGVGKTTLLVNCAEALAFSGHRVLLLDLDAQANLTRHLLKLEPGVPLDSRQSITAVLLRRLEAMDARLETGVPGLHIIPGSTDLEDLPLLDMKLPREPGRLRIALTGMEDEYDFILVDCPPALNWLTRQALYAMQKVVVPIQAEPYALQGLFDLVPALDRMTATAQIHRIVINMYRHQTGLHQMVAKQIEAAFPGRVATQRIRQTIQMAEATRQGMSLFQYDPASLGAQDLFALCFELFQLDPEVVKARVGIEKALSPQEEEDREDSLVPGLLPVETHLPSSSP
jgi:chromosome partitioning protein